MKYKKIDFFSQKIIHFSICLAFFCYFFYLFLYHHQVFTENNEIGKNGPRYFTGEDSTLKKNETTFPYQLSCHVDLKFKGVALL